MRNILLTLVLGLLAVCAATTIMAVIAIVLIIGALFLFLRLVGGIFRGLQPLR